MLCKDCKFWERKVLYKYKWSPGQVDYCDTDPSTWAIPEEGEKIETCLGECYSPNIKYSVFDDNSLGEGKQDKNSNSLIYCDSEAYRGYHLTGENFGCIHFEEKFNG